jgi:AraC-like DNA-binding protein
MMSGRPRLTYSSLLLRPFFQVLPHQPLLSECRTSRIAVQDAHALLASAAQALGDQRLGLKAGLAATRGDGGTLDYAMHAASTVAEAFETAARFIRLVNGGLAMQVIEEGRFAFLRLESHTIEPDLAEDFMMGAIYMVHIRRLIPAGTELECRFTQKAPAHMQEHELAFSHARLKFAEAFRGFAFDRTCLARPLTGADKRLHGLLVRSMERDLCELAEAPTFTERARNLLQLETPLRSSTLPLVASALGLSPRTFARRLKEEGTEFSDLLDSVRWGRAQRYLVKGMSAEDVTKLLGFSRSSAFHRAFKRWSGTTSKKFLRTR